MAHLQHAIVYLLRVAYLGIAACLPVIDKPLHGRLGSGEQCGTPKKLGEVREAIGLPVHT